MSRQKLRVADVLRCCWTAYNRTHRLPPFVAQTVRILLKCRTALLGGHIYQCDQCGSETPLYNSCKNRNCPTCQNVEKEKWLARRLREVLPVPYYHTVFTLPHELNDLVNGNRRLLLDELFQTSKWVLQRFAHDPKWRLQGELGMIAILHTWSQRLAQHFHVHYLIPGGVWQKESDKFIVSKGNWLFKKTSFADAFRNRFIKRLRKLRTDRKLNYPNCCITLKDDDVWEALLEKLRKTRWVVYPKRVPSTTGKALEYLARYTHRIAISDYRIKKLINGYVTYTWRDRASPDSCARTSRTDRNREKEECIRVEEFTKRFLQHILPRGFKKIRFYGWMSNTKRKAMLALIRKQLNETPPDPGEKETAAQIIFHRTGYDVTCCPNCKKGTLTKTAILLPNAQGP